MDLDACLLANSCQGDLYFTGIVRLKIRFDIKADESRRHVKFLFIKFVFVKNKSWLSQYTEPVLRGVLMIVLFPVVSSYIHISECLKNEHCLKSGVSFVILRQWWAESFILNKVFLWQQQTHLSGTWEIVFALVLKTKGIAVLICRFVLTPWPETVLIYIKLKYFTAFVLMDEILLKG